MGELVRVMFVQPHYLNGLLHAAGCKRHVTEKCAKMLAMKGAIVRIGENCQVKIGAA